jgi:hypothetical protein
MGGVYKHWAKAAQAGAFLPARKLPGFPPERVNIREGVAPVDGRFSCRHQLPRPGRMAGHQRLSVRIKHQYSLHGLLHNLPVAGVTCASSMLVGLVLPDSFPAFPTGHEIERQGFRLATHRKVS